MKKIVCREDIQAEMEMLSKLQTDISFIKAQLDILEDRVNFLETKNMRGVSIGTPITSTRIWPEPYSYWWEAIPDRISDWHWIVNDDQTITYDGNWNDRPNSNTN